jgi:DNA mismatch repair ATPase MutS
MSDESKDMNIVDMYHPLLEKPISNTISIDSSIAITGSNMSGKSTFLRTVGLSSLFAQSICTSLSKEHSSKFYRLVTSISLNDDILQGKSYFLMEAEAIKRMVDSCNDETPLLILIDEIFKGTNPVERLAASMEILNLLAKANTKTLVATHDLQILPELKNYEYYYFTENVTKDSLEFDYKIHEGITSTRNAIKVLEFINYPSGLVDLINKRIEVMEL